MVLWALMVTLLQCIYSLAKLLPPDNATPPPKAVFTGLTLCMCSWEAECPVLAFSDPTPGNNILIVAHASSLEACTCQLQGLSPQNSKDFVQMVRKVIGEPAFQGPGGSVRSAGSWGLFKSGWWLSPWEYFLGTEKMHVLIGSTKSIERCSSWKALNWGLDEEWK